MPLSWDLGIKTILLGHKAKTTHFIFRHNLEKFTPDAELGPWDEDTTVDCVSNCIVPKQHILDTTYRIFHQAPH